MTAFRIRPAVQTDAAFLGAMLVAAAQWRDRGGPPAHEVLADPAYSRYLSGWMRPGDTGAVAVDDHDDTIGAAWYRMLPRTDAGFGYVATGVPELIIGVRPIWRAHGVGRALLRQLCDQARQQGHARLSLSVDRGNFARALYRTEGFAVVQREADRDTMVKRLR